MRTTGESCAKKQPTASSADGRDRRPQIAEGSGDILTEEEDDRGEYRTDGDDDHPVLDGDGAGHRITGTREQRQKLPMPHRLPLPMHHVAAVKDRLPVSRWANQPLETGCIRYSNAGALESHDQDKTL